MLACHYRSLRQYLWGRLSTHCHLPFPALEMLRNSWGRLSACGGLTTRLGGICILVGRPIDNRPQVANLPHIRPRARLSQYWCSVVGKVSGTGFSTCGGFLTRLGGLGTPVGRPSATRPQDTILPHIRQPNDKSLVADSWEPAYFQHFTPPRVTRVLSRAVLTVRTEASKRTA